MAVTDGDRAADKSTGEISKNSGGGIFCVFFSLWSLLCFIFFVRGIDGKFLRGIDILWGKWGRGGGELESAADDWNRKRSSSSAP